MIARTVDQIGIDHVGIGTDLSRKLTSDFLRWVREGRWTHTPEWGAGSAKEGHVWLPWPVWFESAKDFPTLTAGLLKLGLSKADVAKIMGGNFLKLFTEGFKPAAKGAA